jgi:DNA-directed RNA polymerase subunit RPC12/RpoP
MNNFNVECPYCGGRMILKEVPNMKSMSYYCEDCIAIMHLTHYDEKNSAYLHIIVSRFGNLM